MSGFRGYVWGCMALLYDRDFGLFGFFCIHLKKIILVGVDSAGFYVLA